MREAQLGTVWLVVWQRVTNMSHDLALWITLLWICLYCASDTFSLDFHHLKVRINGIWCFPGWWQTLPSELCPMLPLSPHVFRGRRDVLARLEGFYFIIHDLEYLRKEWSENAVQPFDATSDTSYNRIQNRIFLESMQITDLSSPKGLSCWIILQL